MLKEFKEFAMRGNVVDMAVGIIIGAAFGKIVSSFINDMVMPPLGILMGNADFSDYNVNLLAGIDGAKAVTLNYGKFLTSVLDFVILAFAVFMMVRMMNKLKRAGEKDATVPAPTDKTCPECKMAIPLEARRCGHCTSVLPAILVLVAALSLFGMPASAEDAPAKPWTANAQVTYLSTAGNTEASTLGSSAGFKYKWAVASLELAAGALGSSSNEMTIAEQYYASEKVLWQFTERNYAFEKVGWEKNRFAGIFSREDANVGLGRELIKTDMQNLILELGGGYVDEQRVESARLGFGSGRAYAKYVLTLSPTSNFSQDAEYLHDFQHPLGYRVNTESAVTSAISTYLSVKLSLGYKHVNKPAPGFVRDDSLTSAALIFSY